MAGTTWEGEDAASGGAMNGWACSVAAFTGGRLLWASVGAVDKAIASPVKAEEIQRTFMGRLPNEHG